MALHTTTTVTQLTQNTHREQQHTPVQSGEQLYEDLVQIVSEDRPAAILRVQKKFSMVGCV